MPGPASQDPNIIASGQTVVGYYMQAAWGGWKDIRPIIVDFGKDLGLAGASIAGWFKFFKKKSELATEKKKSRATNLDRIRSSQLMYEMSMALHGKILPQGCGQPAAPQYAALAGLTEAIGTTSLGLVREAVKTFYDAEPLGPVEMAAKIAASRLGGRAGDELLNLANQGAPSKPDDPRWKFWTWFD